ncbi:MAG: DUF2339 domain-containing protein [Myxococcales bacterium]|nr:MAG: DUF2339 domain-containing protein [Myxococcales bacterium]
MSDPMNAAQVQQQIDALEKRIRKLETQLGIESVSKYAALHEEIQPAQSQVPISTPEPFTHGGIGPSEKHQSKLSLTTLAFAALGSVLFLLGASFFLRWAIEQGLLSAPVRILLALAAGFVMFALCLRLIKKEQQKLSVAFAVTGLGVVAYALHYGAITVSLISLPIAFVSFVVFVAFTAYLAWRANYELLLAWALVAAYMAPFLFSQGQSKPVFTTVYAGSVVLAMTIFSHVVPASASWSGSRMLAMLGNAFWLIAAAFSATPHNAHVILLLFLLSYGIWALFLSLPLSKVVPTAFAGSWILGNMFFVTAVRVVFKELHWQDHRLALCFVCLSGLSYAWSPWLGSRFKRPALSWISFAIATAYLYAAVALLLDGAWVSLAFSLLSVAMVLAMIGTAPRFGSFDPLTGLATVATLYLLLSVWAWLGYSRDASLFEAIASAFFGDRSWSLSQQALSTPLAAFDALFFSGLLLSFGCIALAKKSKAVAPLAFVTAEGVIHLSLALSFYTAIYSAFSLSAAGYTITFFLALSGTLQWLLSLRSNDQARLGFSLFGHGLLFLSAAKLVLTDMQDASLGVRALISLVLGALLLGLAWISVKNKTSEAAA